jgi:hypothetical protein
MQFEFEKIKKKFIDLEKNILAVFCLLCAERMKGIFKAFCNKYSIKYQFYEKAIESGYLQVFNPNNDPIKQIKFELKGIIPDTEDYSDILADQAQCACICLIYAFEYSETGDASYAAYCVQKIFEAIEIYIYETTGEDKTVENNDLIMKEFKWQEDVIKKLEDHIKELSTYINQIRLNNKKYSIPNL